MGYFGHHWLAIVALLLVTGCNSGPDYQPTLVAERCQSTVIAVLASLATPTPRPTKAPVVLPTLPPPEPASMVPSQVRTYLLFLDANVGIANDAQNAYATIVNELNIDSTLGRDVSWRSRAMMSARRVRDAYKGFSRYALVIPRECHDLQGWVMAWSQERAAEYEDEAQFWEKLDEDYHSKARAHYDASVPSGTQMLNEELRLKQIYGE